MDTTYDVRIWKTKVYEGKRLTTYWVRWMVAGREFKEPLRLSAQAESFRSELMTAARRGEAFYTETGLPVTVTRTASAISWYRHAQAFADMKWPRVAATTRRTHAEALTAFTEQMFTTTRGKPDDQLIRTALRRWGYNTAKRDDPERPAWAVDVLKWVERNTLPVSALAKPEVLRRVLDGLTVRLDGAAAAPSVVSRRRKILNTCIEYAVETKQLKANPIPALKWKPPKSTHGIDRRSVANPVQARSLLASVREQGRIGPRMVAFYGCLYYAALRPEEAVGLFKHNLSIPAEGWGEMTLEKAEPFAGKEWTDSGKNRDDRQLKQRARGETRTVPCPPELTALLNEHLDEFGTGPDGRVFVGERNKNEVPRGTINRVWQRARRDAFTPEALASPLARTPYDLRHAAVSTWLNGGVPSTQVAEWAGHSVEVLLKIYAKCLDGGSSAMRKRIEAALGHG